MWNSYSWKVDLLSHFNFLWAQAGCSEIISIKNLSKENFKNMFIRVFLKNFLFFFFKYASMQIFLVIVVDILWYESKIFLIIKFSQKNPWKFETRSHQYYSYYTTPTMADIQHTQKPISLCTLALNRYPSTNHNIGLNFPKFCQSPKKIWQ